MILRNVFYGINILIAYLFIRKTISIYLTHHDIEYVIYSSLKYLLFSCLYILELFMSTKVKLLRVRYLIIFFVIYMLSFCSLLMIGINFISYYTLLDYIYIFLPILPMYFNYYLLSFDHMLNLKVITAG